MIKKTITYTDYNGNERTEDFYFHISQAKLLELEVGAEGGYGKMLENIAHSGDGATIIKTFKQFILGSYGIKSADGRSFEQSEEISRQFENTEAYSVLLMELCNDPKVALEFITSVLPLNNDQKAEVEKKISELPS